MQKLLMALLILVVAGSAGAWVWHRNAKPAAELTSAKIDRGDVASVIVATGTLEPEEVVDVGAQVEGLIQSFGTDAAGNVIDYRSPVEANMVLARIDDAVYRADLDTAKAQLDQAAANVQHGEADLATAKAKLFQTEQTWNRAKVLGPSDALSQNDYDMYQADYETAKAGVAVADAEIAQAKTGIAQSQAALDKAQRNLDFCVIKSPVKGVIIDRRVNIGQTVVSSLNAPSLFLIAKDLTKMQIWVAVNEADVGRIIPGAPVTFTSDAFPGRIFNGTVGKVRLNATMTQNVVMYTVEIETPNPDNQLLPYLTANVHFVIQQEQNVLLVPNAALRWYPTVMSEVSPEFRSWKASDPGPASDKDKTPSQIRQGVIWLRDGQYLHPVEVKVGTSDGIVSAVTGENLTEGLEVITGEVAQAAQDANTNTNPFMPPVMRRR